MLRCPRCQSISHDDSRLCASCGNSFVPPTVIPNKNNSAIAGVVLLMVVISCAICALLGKLGKNQNNSFNTPTTASSNKNYISEPQNSPTREETPKTLVSPPSSSSKSATVITENANLRDAPNSAGSVIQTVPEGAGVEVLKQKGAWFYVSLSGQKGWMHGNTIRYENELQTSKSIQSKTDYSTPKPTFSPGATKMTEPEINNSGATARCRDGTLSYSRNRRGTCSHHGGVAVWF